MSTQLLSEELSWRGFANQTTFADPTELDKTKRTFYFGVDPSATSMQIGNLAAAMMARTFMRHGYKAILLIGGATGLIGDPDGKADERNLKTPEEITKNKQAIVEQYKQVFAGFDFEVVDNFDWFKDMHYLDFLRDIGKHVPMRQMLSRDFVQTRLAEGGNGISYAEFSYVLIQAFDFLHLNKTKGVTLQLSGSDQWGNSIAGVDLIRRLTGAEAHVWTTPLILNKTTGQKFGKTEGGAIWLAADQTTPYDFYQFWLNVDDESVEDYLKVFTELDQKAVNEVMTDFNTDRSSRAAQKRLAYEVTKLVHGEQFAKENEAAAKQLFSNKHYDRFSKDDFMGLGLTEFTVNNENSLVELLVESGLASSNTEARRFLASGAIYINDKVAADGKQKLDENDFVQGHLVLRRGKNTQVLITKK